MYTRRNTLLGRCGHDDVIPQQRRYTTSMVNSIGYIGNKIYSNHHYHHQNNDGKISHPRRIEALSNVRVIDISSGDEHTLCNRSDRYNRQAFADTWYKSILYPRRLNAGLIHHQQLES